MLHPVASPSNSSAPLMLISGDFNLSFKCADFTPMMLMVRIRPERAGDCVEPEKLTFQPGVPAQSYLDGFGNICTRLVAPPGDFSIWNRFLIADSGLPEQL